VSEERLSKRETDALINELIERFDAITVEIDEERKAEFFWRCIIGLLTFVLGVLVGTVAP
jgi:hypothetical protein